MIMANTKAPVQASAKKGAAKKGRMAGKKSHKPGKQALKGKGLGKVGGKKATLKFSIDCAHPVEDGIMNCDDFNTYLNERIKVKIKTQTCGTIWVPLCENISNVIVDNTASPAVPIVSK